MFKKLILSFCLLFSPVILQGEVVEIMHMEEILPHVKPEMLIVFDIDNTIIEPVQTLGSDQWFHHRIETYLSYGYNPSDALQTALKEWMSVQNITKVKLVEDGIDKVIADLQEQGFTVMGLTTRGLGMCLRTIEQLDTVGVSFRESSPTKEEIHFMNERGILFRSGILFTAATHKGEALRMLLKRAGYQAKSVMFVNDKYSHIVPIEEVCEGEEIPFIGLRYGHVDEKVKNFPEQIGEVQFYHFGHILTDDAAERILHGK